MPDNPHRILLIAKRDYLATIRTKAFIIGLVVAPLLFGGGVLLLLLAIYPMEILIALSLVYLALIPFGLRRYKALARQEESKVGPPA